MMKFAFDPMSTGIPFLSKGEVTGFTKESCSSVAPMSKRHKDAMEAKSSIGFRSGAVTRNVWLTNSVSMLEFIKSEQLCAVRLSNGDIYGRLQLKKESVSFCVTNNTVQKIVSAKISGISMYTDHQTLKALVSVIFTVSAVDKDQECRSTFTECYHQVTTPTSALTLSDSCYRFCDAVTYYLRTMLTCTCEVQASDNFSAQCLMAVQTGNAHVIPGIKPLAEYEAQTQQDRNRAKREKKEEAKKPQEETAKAESETAEDPLKPYRDGKYRISFGWTERQQERVVPPDFLDSFVPVPEFFRLMRKLDYRLRERILPLWEVGMTDPAYTRGDAVNVLLYGNPGTGKTVLAHALSAATGLPLYETKFDKYTESDEIEGKNKIVEGKLAFAETDFLEGYENGGIILMEEINCADQNMLTGTLNNAIEYPSFIMKNGYQKVTRHPMTVIIATMNVGTEGTMWLNQAFASRFKQKYRIADPSPDDFIRFLTKYGYTQYDAKYVYDAYTKIKSTLLENRSTAEYALNLSTRACLGALENMAEGDDPKTAITDTLVGAVGIVDPQTADMLETNVVTNLPNYRPPKKVKGRTSENI